VDLTDRIKHPRRGVAGSENSAHEPAGRLRVTPPIALVRVDRGLEQTPAAKSNKRRVRWIFPLVVFLLAAGVTFLGVYIEASRSGSGLAVPRFMQAILPDASLGLRVEYQGEHLLVTWSRRSPAVRAAVAGVLRIEDGSQRRDVHLDAEQVAGGSILYKPASDDVIFRLELRNAQGNATVESMRVLASANAPATNATSQPNLTQPAQTTDTAPKLPVVRQRPRAVRDTSGSEPTDRSTESPGATDSPAQSPSSVPPNSTSPVNPPLGAA
jgi:hypothetical protein